MWRRVWVVLLIVVCGNLHAENSSMTRHAISFRYTGCPDHLSRFGDRALGYAQARYLSYLTSIPFLYRNFPYSDKISIDFQALPYDQEAHRYRSHFYINSANTLVEFFQKASDPSTPPTLFIVDYFPTEISEWEFDHSRSVHLDNPWADSGFRDYIKQAFIPKIPIPILRKEGFLNVAVYIRTLSGADVLGTLIGNP